MGVASVFPLDGAASQLLVVTAQGQGGAAPRLPPFDAARTVVVLMGVGRIPAMAADYAAAGYPAHTPVAVVERASQEGERVTRSTLARLADDAARVGVTSPAVIVVGAVVDVLHVAGAASAAAAAGATGAAGAGDSEAAATKVTATASEHLQIQAPRAR